MTGSKWWMRIVGGFYLLLTLINAYAFVFDPGFFRNTLPFPADDLALRAFVDAWMVFVLELAVLGVMLLYASADPHRNRVLILTVVLAEVFRGVVADAIWITRGYSAGSYIPFIVVHLLIIVTGWMAYRREAARVTAQPI